MPGAATRAREIAALVPMARLLCALGFSVNERTHRSACVLHGGSNPTAFSWREDGRWCCFSCGRGGDKLGLVRGARGCGFRDAVQFLARLTGVNYAPRRIPRAEIEHARKQHERAERAPWDVTDRVFALRSYYHAAMLRAERLSWRIGERMKGAPAEAEAGWAALARLAPAQTFFLAAWHLFTNAPAGTLAQAALTTPAGRRRMILVEEVCDEQRAAA